MSVKKEFVLQMPKNLFGRGIIKSSYFFLDMLCGFLLFRVMPNTGCWYCGPYPVKLGARRQARPAASS